MTDKIEAALKKAYLLGQERTDNEYYSQIRMADETQARFDALVSETVALLREAAQAENEALRRGVAALVEAITSALDGPLLDDLGNRDEGGLRAYPDLAWVKKTLQDALADHRKKGEGE